MLGTSLMALFTRPWPLSLLSEQPPCRQAGQRTLTHIPAAAFQDGFLVSNASK